MLWKKINSARLQSDAGYVVEALGSKGEFVYVVWPPVADGDRVFKWPHRVIKSFSGKDQAKQFCEQHLKQGIENAA